jgi:putative transposase
MPNTYTQLQIHFVFAVKWRLAVIDQAWEERLHQYITAIVQNNDHKMLAINSAYDHTHFVAGINPKQSISDLLELVKGDSSEFINTHKFTRRKFNWQSGYGAFSISRSHLDKAVKYVHNQKIYHQKQPFREEYLQLLKKYEIVYDEKYIFHDLLD